MNSRLAPSSRVAGLYMTSEMTSGERRLDGPVSVLAASCLVTGPLVRTEL